MAALVVLHGRTALLAGLSGLTPGWPLKINGPTTTTAHQEEKKKDLKGEEEFSTDPFTILEPRNQEIGEFYVVKTRRTKDFDAPELWKGQSGSSIRPTLRMSAAIGPDFIVILLLLAPSHACGRLLLNGESLLQPCNVNLSFDCTMCRRTQFILRKKGLPERW